MRNPRAFSKRIDSMFQNFLLYQDTASLRNSTSLNSKLKTTAFMASQIGPFILNQVHNSPKLKPSPFSTHTKFWDIELLFGIDCCNPTLNHSLLSQTFFCRTPHNDSAHHIIGYIRSVKVNFKFNTRISCSTKTTFLRAWEKISACMWLILQLGERIRCLHNNIWPFLVKSSPLLTIPVQFFLLDSYYKWHRPDFCNCRKLCTNYSFK